MTRIACLTDTHWTARKSSRHLHDYFELFYKNIFFPALEEQGVEIVVHMGDAFDNRKSIDFWGLDWTRRVVLEPLRNYEVHMIVGNHDIFLRNSTEINAPELLLKDYPNIKTYSSPTNTKVGGIDMTFIPWICSENYDETLKVIKKSKAKIAMILVDFISLILKLSSTLQLIILINYSITFIMRILHIKCLMSRSMRIKLLR